MMLALLLWLVAGVPHVTPNRSAAAVDARPVAAEEPRLLVAVRGEKLLVEVSVVQGQFVEYAYEIAAVPGPSKRFIYDAAIRQGKTGHNWEFEWLRKHLLTDVARAEPQRGLIITLYSRPRDGHDGTYKLVESRLILHPFGTRKAAAEEGAAKPEGKQDGDRPGNRR
jgi:hypothetical protein